MLIYIDDSIIADLSVESKSFSPTITALEYLAMAHMEGKHLVTGSRKVLTQILSLNGHLSHKNITLYKRLLHEVPQYGCMHTKLSTYCRVFNFESEYKKTKTGDNTIIQLPISFFDDSSKVQPVNLVSENTDDTKLFQHICRAYSFENKLNNIKTKFQPIMGGGDQTAKQFTNYQEKGLFTICVVDSDKQHPNDSFGNTAKKVIEANDRSVFTDYYLLECREIENLISERQLQDVCKGDQNRMRAVNFISKLEKSKNNEKRFYIDFKNGLKLLDILAYPAGSERRKYWGNFKDLICEHSDVDNECIATETCSKKPSCLIEKKRVCRSIIMYPLGEKIFESSLKILDKLSPLKIVESLCSFTRAQWLSLGSFVFAWSCTGNRTTS